MLINDNKKVFEKPSSGEYIGVVADSVDLGIVKTKFGEKVKVRIVWILGKADGTGYAVDSEGNPFRVMSELNATMNEKSDMYKLVRGILGQAPPVPYESENLIGKSNVLFVVQEPSKDGSKIYANVKGILPLRAGMQPLAIPANFVRFKDKKDTRTGTAGQQAAAPAQQAAGQPATTAPVQQQADVVLDKAF